MSRVHIIGAGFSGLTLGYFLSRLGVTVEIYEKNAKVGGLIESLDLNWGLVETAANGLLNSPLVEELFRDLDLEFAERPKGQNARYIYRDGKKKWPLSFTETARFFTGFLALISSSSLRRPKPDEKLETYIVRHLGRAAFDYLASPALQGVYGSSDLDAEIVLRSFLKNRKRRGKLKIRGTVAPQGGVGELIEKLSSEIQKNGGLIHLNQSGDLRRTHPTAICTDAANAALLLVENADLAGKLAKIEYSPLTTVTVGMKKEAARLTGFGCLFPRKEKFNSLGVLFNNCIFQDRSSEHSETWMFSSVLIKDDEIKKQILEDRARLMKGAKDEIRNIQITRWPHAVPLYNAGLRNTIDELELPPQIYLHGNYLGGLGLAKILQASKDLAEKIKYEL